MEGLFHSRLNRFVALFPDAPTPRGTKHVQEMINFKKYYGDAKITFIVLREDAKILSPNTDCDPSFTKIYMIPLLIVLSC